MPFVYRSACVVVLFTAPIAIGLYSVVLSDAKIGNREFELGLRWLLTTLTGCDSTAEIRQEILTVPKIGESIGFGPSFNGY